MDYTQQSHEPIFNFGMDETARASMLETARWAKFIAIMGFIFLGILIVAGIFLSMTLSNNPYMQARGMGGIFGGFSIVLYVIMAAIYFYPTYALYKFSRLIKPALLTENQQMFNTALGYLKGMFKYTGIVMIVVLALYGVIIIGGLLYSL